jgi:adenosine deaminase
VAVSVNTDDPALLDTSLVREYALCHDTFEWSDDDLWSVARKPSMPASPMTTSRRSCVMR